MFPNMEKVITSSALIIIDDDVVKTYTNPDMEYDDQAANENIEAIWGQVRGKRIFNLIVSDPTTHVTVEARGFTHREFEKLKIAEAIVIKTLGHRILADYYAQAKSRKYPCKVFDCESKAIEWFESVKEKSYTN